MFLFMTAAAMAASTTPVSAVLAPRALIRIEHPAVVNASEWERPSPDLQQRERIVTDERGQIQLLRVVDYQ